jgi:hypothetical protein
MTIVFRSDHGLHRPTFVLNIVTLLFFDVFDIMILSRVFDDNRVSFIINAYFLEQYILMTILILLKLSAILINFLSLSQ